MINKGKDIREVVKEAERVLNINYNRSIKPSTMILIQHTDFYDALDIRKIIV